jgi:putative Holliday junction resolvase
MAAEARAFAAELAKRTGLKIEFWDERLSTAQAERAMIEADMSRRHRQQRIDKVAAQMILQGYLDSRRAK